MSASINTLYSICDNDIYKMIRGANILVELMNDSKYKTESDLEAIIIKSDNIVPTINTQIKVIKKNSYYNQNGIIFYSGNGFYHIKLQNSEIIKLRKNEFIVI